MLSPRVFCMSGMPPNDLTKKNTEQTSAAICVFVKDFPQMLIPLHLNRAKMVSVQEISAAA